MPKVALPIPQLDENQKDFIRRNIHLELKTLVQQVFNNPVLTLRNVETKAVKNYIASLGKTTIIKGVEQKIKRITLTEDHKTYIKNNFERCTTLEMARILSMESTEKLSMPNNPWMISILEFCRSLDPTYGKNEDTVVGDYIPPTSISVVMGMVNKYAINTRGDGRSLYDSIKTTPEERKCLQMLVGYMGSPLFVAHANKYVKQVDRDLFESEFIKLCWDKPDLLAEELTQYISLAAETVKYIQIERQVQMLDNRLNAVLTEGDDNKPLKMAEVELLNSVREKATASMKQQAALIQKLAGDRAKRLENKIEANSSLLKLVEMWKKEDDRKKIIALAQKRNEKIKEEVERLSSIDSLKAEIFGLDPNTIYR